MPIIKSDCDKTDYKNAVLYDPELRLFYPEVIFEGGNAVENPGYIELGKSVRVGHHTSIHAVTSYNGEYYPSINIGEGTIIGSYNAIASCNKISIGNNVLFGPYVHVNDHSHCFDDITKPIMYQPVFSKGPVVINDDCWLGFGCHILSGVTIGKHSVVGANSVVTADVDPFSIVVGSPARVVKNYNFKKNRWEAPKNKSIRFFFFDSSRP
jgi:acetyltransferase-like isoleucine patch superfamily enzyme